MSSCFPWRWSRSEDREPLLPQYNDDTALQRTVHQKLHTYLMLRALTKGFMPSNEQTIVNLRTLLAADILNPDNPDLSDSGRRLIKYTYRWLQQFIELLQHKNDGDQIQDFIWHLSRSRISVDTGDISHRASNARAKADTAAAYKSLQTVGSLLLTNSDFRIFLSDLNTVGREVFKDSAFKLSGVAEEAGKRLEPSDDEQNALKQPGADAGPAPSGNDLGDEVAEVSKVVGNGAVEVAKEAQQSLTDKLTGEEKETLLNRLKEAVVKLRNRPNYSDSVSTLSQLIKRYALVYSRALQDTVGAAQDDVHTNPETDIALKNFWNFLTSFGDKNEWNELQNKLHKVLDHRQNDPELEDFMTDLGNSLQKLLTDPNFLEHADEKFQELRKKSREVGNDSSLRDDVDALLVQCQTTLQSVLHDQDIAKLLQTTKHIVSILSPAGEYVNTDLFTDAINTFVPLLIQAIQYVPIPRLEISTPDIDLLLENLIIEPGRTVNHTSFLPYRLRVETFNDLEIRKARFRTVSRVSSRLTIKLDGLSLRADEFGFWLRAHSGLLRLADAGIASFALDDRGIDIHLDVEIARDRLEHAVSLRAVRVHLHKLSYVLRRSRLSFFAWLLKPLLRPLLRKLVERQLALAVADAVHAANRELLFVRERLRATRVADPDDLATFVRAVLARLTPEDDPDLYSRVGVAEPGKGVFKGVYAPGSLVRLWDQEARDAGFRVEEASRDGWRNDVFDVHVGMMT